ncbi:MAG: hypothetical protein ACTSQQ_01830 [Candidatus Helarchaeota archaeon]
MMVGAGWGVSLVDGLINAGFEVPEFTEPLKGQLKELLPSYRVSVKNPVDYGDADTMEFTILRQMRVGAKLNFRKYVKLLKEAEAEGKFRPYVDYQKII